MKTSLYTLVATFLFSATVLFAAETPATCPKAADAKCDKAAACCAGKKDQACEKCAQKKVAAACDKAAANCQQTAAAECAAKKCPVSGEALGSMGKPYSYTYKQAGQSDRTIELCCKACVKKFEKDPANYLAKLDACKK